MKKLLIVFPIVAAFLAGGFVVQYVGPRYRFKLPDLTVDAPSCTRSAGGLQVRANVYNRGEADAGPFAVSIEQVGSGLSIESTSVNGLSHDPTAMHNRVSVPLPVDGEPDVTNALLRLRVVVDPTDAMHVNGGIWEWNEANNQACAICECTAQGCTHRDAPNCQFGP
jgi:CARDB protein